MTGGLFLLRAFTVLCWVGNQQKVRKRKTPQVVLFTTVQAARRGGGCQGELFSSSGQQASVEMVQRSATLMWAPCLLLRNTEWKQNDKKKSVFFQLTPSIHNATWAVPLIAQGVITEAGAAHREWGRCWFSPDDFAFWTAQQQEIRSKPKHGFKCSGTLWPSLVVAPTGCQPGRRGHAALAELALGCLGVDRAACSCTTPDSCGREEGGR